MRCMRLCYNEAKDYEKSLRSFKCRIREISDNAQLHFYYGTIFMTARVIKSYSRHAKVNELQSEYDPQGLNYLAFTWAEMDKNMDEAEKLARRAVTLDPEDGYILDTLGWILFKRGSKKEALKFLEAATTVQPTVSIIAEHLGDIYRDTSMGEKAKSMYKKAFDLEIDKKKAKELQEKILAIENQAVPERTPASVGK